MENISLDSSNIVEKSICLSFDDAINKLPDFLQVQNNELGEFLRQVDHLHKFDGHHHITARFIFDYVQYIVKRFDEGKLSDPFTCLPESLDQLSTISGNVSCEIAVKVMNGVDPHNIALSILNLLENLRWETKAVVTIYTYMMTFGDFGLNLCPKSKLSPNIKETPQIIKDLIDIIRSIVLYDNLPPEFMTSNDLDFKGARTYFIIVVYWTVRVVVDFAKSNIWNNSNRYNKFEEPTLLPLSMLKSISYHLATTYDELHVLLGDKVDSEAYKKIKEIMQQKDHIDNMEVLSVLISPYTDAPRLYRGALNIEAQLTELEGKYVLLFLSDMGKNMNAELIYIIQQSTFEVWGEHEVLFIPFINRSKQYKDETKMFFEIAKKFMPWYYVDHPSKIKNAAVKFFRDDWNVKDEPIIVVLDPRGKVVNPNAIPMMMMWQSNSFPFTNRREEALLKQLTWKLELLVGRIDPKISDWIQQDKYIFMFGGQNIEWIRSFTSLVRSVSKEIQVCIEMVYAGMFHRLELVPKVCDCIFSEELSHCLQNYSIIRFFWRRMESMKNLMIKHGKADNLFQETQMLLDYDNSNVEWAILAKGSKILYNGHGKTALSILYDFNNLKKKVSNLDFEEAFQTHYHAIN